MHLKKMFILIACLVATSAFAKQNASKVEIEIKSVAKGVYMLVGGGGNIGLFVGHDGALLTGVPHAPLTGNIQEAVSKVTDKPVRYLINTHWHGDRGRGNKTIGNGDTIIVAHDNARKRMAKGQYMKVFKTRIPPAPPEMLPDITFTDSLTFYWSNEKLELFHPKSAHSDGDAVIYLELANVVHAGDLFFNGMYPFIDAESGGSMEGVIAGIDKVLERIYDDTKVIPGHGPMGSKAELKAYRDMLEDVHGRMTKLIKEGKNIDEIIAAKPTADYDAKWGGGLLKPDRWVQIVYAGMQK